MLTLLCGRSGTENSKRILALMREGAQRGITDRVLLVPEQFSHEAERSLAAALGDAANLYAEVLSFTRLAVRVNAECGGMADVVPDRGTKLLMLSLAITRVASQLTICGGRATRTGHLVNVLDAIEELDGADISDDAMLDAADAAGGAIAEKLRDLAVIREAYLQVRAELLPDPRELLDRLIDRLPDSTVGRGGIFIDGFTDFTRKEMNVIDCFLRRGVDVTVALTMDGTDAEEFSICEKTKNSLADTAARRAVPCEILHLRSRQEKPEELNYLDTALTDYSVRAYDGERGAVEIYRAASQEEEYALAASRILEMMRADPSLRRRDFTVAVRGYENVAPACESVMKDYGIAAYSGRRADIMQKPLMRLVTSALDTVTGGWRQEDIFTFLKTGLSGIPDGDIDILENYCLTWGIRGISAWTREQPWTLNPAGRTGPADEEGEVLLGRINATRTRAAAVLSELDLALKNAPTVGEKTRAVWNMLEQLQLNERLSAREDMLRQTGDMQTADETGQLWGILIDSLERLYAVLGTVETDTDEFARHVKLLLAQYDVGTIPTSLDAVALCDLNEVRGRPKRCIIVLGATADAIPFPGARDGMFTGDEREKLAGLGIEIGDSGDRSVARELFTVYSAFTSASEKLILSWSEGGERQTLPSFIVTRISKTLGIEPVRVDAEECMTFAYSPCLRLAVCGKDPLAEAARKCAEECEQTADKYAELSERLNAVRGRLTPESVTALYGNDISISASRAERFSSCRFNYFLKYGLRAQPRKKAGFDAADMGTFVHYILENVAREIKELGGFSAVDEDGCSALADKYLTEYAETLLDGRERSGRFVYLLGKMKETVRRIVAEIISELRDSDFEPLDFELSFAEDGDLPPAVLSNGNSRIRVGGVVDRVDGWSSGDRLYLRVADYKTGRKEFSLSDVWYGLGMQMLIYLFVLADKGGARYGQNVVPAGVLYLPTRDAVLSMSRESTDEEIEDMRHRKNKRTGIALNEPDVLSAMERGGSLRLDFKGKGGRAPVTLASAEELGRLSRYVRKYLAEMGKELRNGSIDAAPCVVGNSEYCRYCDFASACAFDGHKDRQRRLKKLSNGEFWERVERGDVYHG